MSKRKQILGCGVDVCSPTYALSNDDINRIMKGRVKVMTYGQLTEFNTVDELLAPHGQVVILYESREGYGHWTCLFKRNAKEIEFFDSYGYVPDDELKMIPKEFRQQSNQCRAHLSHLMADSHYAIHYNDHPFQSSKPGISTCGKWCCFRMLNKKSDVDSFWNMVNTQCKEKKCTRDELVCQYIC